MKPRVLPIHIIAISVFVILAAINTTSAGIVQWRVRVPSGEPNPNNIGSYVNTIEIGNGGTTGYDSGLDVDLDTSIVPNTYFFVSYVEHGSEKVEYEFTQDLQTGESYTARLSFDNATGAFFFTPNTIEFLAADGQYSYDLQVDTNDNGSFDTFRSGSIADAMQGNGEIAPWDQLIFLGNNHNNGWYYGELKITNVAPEPTSLAFAAIGLMALSLYRRNGIKNQLLG